MKAEADLEALVRNDRTQPVTKKEIDAAKAANKAARLKLERLLAPADSADVTAARLELAGDARAQARLGPMRQAQSSGHPQPRPHVVRARVRVFLAFAHDPPFRPP